MIAVLAMIAAVVLTRIGRDGWAFVASAVATAALTSGWFVSLYPNVLPSTLDPAFSLNIENAASTPYTLTLMSWIALVFSPFILAYQAWSYWVFRKRISVKHIPESPTELPPQLRARPPSRRPRAAAGRRGGPARRDLTPGRRGARAPGSSGVGLHGRRFRTGLRTARAPRARADRRTRADRGGETRGGSSAARCPYADAPLPANDGNRRRSVRLAG